MWMRLQCFKQNMPKRKTMKRHLEHDLALKQNRTGTQTEWPDCMTIPTFAGKCPVEEHPGACYRTDGKMWSCWADWEELDDDDCQSMVLNDKVVGFEGACKYELWGKSMKESDVPDCSDVGKCLKECDPITDKWGACYVKDDTGVDSAERCICALKPDAPGGDRAFLDTLLKYGCKTKQIGYMDKAYDDLCIFSDNGQQTESSTSTSESSPEDDDLPSDMKEKMKDFKMARKHFQPSLVSVETKEKQS